jgi:Mor family transcriptional regulator
LEVWLKEVTPELIPDDYRELAEDIGVENLIKLSRYAAGSSLYIPVPNFFLRPIRNQKIKKEFDGSNTKTLCKKYDLSERQVRTIINTP